MNRPVLPLSRLLFWDYMNNPDTKYDIKILALLEINTQLCSIFYQVYS